MRVRIFQHVPFEGIGSLGQWLSGRTAKVAWTRMFRGDPIPEVSDYDWLIVMGGPMGAHDEASFPWLAEEKRAILAAIEGGRRVLGVCLGAQLVAAALGARVYRNPEREIGWHAVHRTGAATPVAEAIPEGSLVFHWHADAFEVPRGAAGFLSSDACSNQAFHLGDRVLGIQFHLETTIESARALIDNCAADLVPGRFVQAGTEILGHPRRFDALRPLLSRVMDAMAGDVVPRASPASA